MYQLLSVFYCTLLISSAALAQSERNYHIQEYTTENGMPSNGIKGLEWDEETGFLWIATEAGVARFNGLDFAVYTKENTPGIFFERMAYIIKSDAGGIYVGDNGGNIVAVKKSSLAPYPFPELDTPAGFKKRFYMAVSDAGLQKKIHALMSKTGPSIWIRLLQPADASCIILDHKRDLLYTAPGMNDFITLPAPQKFNSAFMIEKSCFVIDAERHIYALTGDLKKFEEKRIITSTGVPVDLNKGTPLLYWENGMQYPILFLDNHAWILKNKAGHIEASLICTVVPSNSFIESAQYSEKNKMLFIGTDSKGIIIISENRVASVKKKETDIRERNAYYSQVELPGGNVLTNEGHVIGPSTNTGPLPIQGKFNFTVHASGDSLLWYAQQNSKYNFTFLHRYNYKTKTTTLFNKIPINQSFAIADAANGSSYIATDEGMGVFETDSLRYLFKISPEKKGIAAPFQLMELSPGVFAAASCIGLIRYNTTTMKADTLLNLPGYCVRSLWQYGDYLFIGTYGKGYYIYKNGVMKSMPVDKNKFLLYTHCFVPDEYGYCWMSTNRGLFKAQLSDLINAFENRGTKVYYHYFGKNDGMEITEMNGGCGPCALSLQNKTISFPTMDGLLWVNPDIAKPLLPEGNIYLDEFRAGNKILNTDSLDELVLPFKPGDIQIRISFSAWCNKENIYLDYTLNNSKEWTPVDVINGAVIKFSNLPAGDYKMVLRKLNGFGINNYSYKEISFSIRTPWHQQWWFTILAALAIFGLVILYLGYRTKQFRIRQYKLEQQVAEKTKELQEQNEILEKNNNIKTRLISIISHDIITPLKFLTVAGKNLLEKKQLMSEELQKETISEITNTSQELQLLSTNILNWIKYQNENRRMTKETFNIHEMVSQVLGILNSLAQQKNLRIVNAIDKELTIHQFYEPLKILVYNLLTNSIHFSEKGTITVRAETKNDTIVVSVQDEGAGMTPEKIQSLMEDHVVISSANVDNRKGHGLGFLIIKDLLKTMGATLHIESRLGAGSTISIIFPN